MVIFAVLTVFWRSLTNGTLYQSSKTLKIIGVPIVTGLPRLYQQCTNDVPIVKNSQKTVKTAKMTIGVAIVAGLPRLYQQCTNRQKQSKTTHTTHTLLNSQSKHNQNSRKNDHWCTNRHRSTKQKQQCNNSLPIVNKNLAIANRSRVSCAHNTSIAFIGLNITPWPWNLD